MTYLIREKYIKKKTPLIGGVILIINLLLLIVLINFEYFKPILQNYSFITFEDLKLYIIFAVPLFLIGLYDDKFDLNPNLKLFLLGIIIFLFLYFDNSSLIMDLNFSFFEKTIHTGKYSYLFTILCYLLFVNACNMFDGINLQLILFSLFIFIIFILKGFFSIFFILLSICLIFLGILNYRNKIFLGDGGSYLLSSIIGCTFIYQYKYFDNFFYGDEVFIILLIPSIDMLRLFIVRSINKKNPFKGDLNHFHHIVSNGLKNDKYTICVTTLMFILPSLLLFFLKIETYYIFIISIIVYTSLILFLKKNIR